MIGAGPGAALSPFAILWPTFAMVALVFAVWLKLVVGRLRHVKANPPTRETFRTGDDARRYFAPVQLPGDNLQNLFETPVLFFALVPLLLMFRQVSVAQLILAWFFVAFRLGHSFVHVGRNDVRLRFQLYVASVAVLSAMWIGFLVDSIAGSRLYELHSGLVAQL